MIYLRTWRFAASAPARKGRMAFNLPAEPIAPFWAKYRELKMAAESAPNSILREKARRRVNRFYQAHAHLIRGNSFTTKRWTPVDQVAARALRMKAMIAAMFAAKKEE